MDAAGSEEDYATISCHGDALWSRIEGHMANLGPQMTMKLFRGTQANKDFHAWLASVLEVASGVDGHSSWVEIPNGESEETGKLRLFACPLDHSRAQALRAVEFEELKEKARAIVLAQEWRPWDVLRISRESGTTGIKGTFIEDFHIRLCSLTALFIIHWEQEWALPQFLQSMGREIPTKYLGYATRTNAMARAVQICASQQCGVTALSWLDIVLQVVEMSGEAASFGSDLQTQVLQFCPEYARKVNSWQHMKSLCSRVDPQCYAYAETVLATHGIPKAILPQCWFRETFFLQPTEKKKRNRRASSHWNKYA